MSHFFSRFPGQGYVCAHRGARSIAPENTFMAFDEARSCGADLWETDIQLSADGELVLFHDRTLERTTNVAELQAFSDRKPWPISHFSFAELQELNAGEWFFSADPFGTVATGEVGKEKFQAIRQQKIPLVRDILEACKSFAFPVNLEIKDQLEPGKGVQLVTKLLALIDELNVADLVLISSFNHDYLRQIKVLNQSLSTAALVEDLHPDNLVAYLHELGVAAYHPDWRIVTTDLVRDLSQAGLRVNLWTVNDLDQARQLLNAGVTFVCSDWPQKLVNSHSA